MSEVCPSHLRLLLILLVLAVLPVAAFAQNDSEALARNNSAAVAQASSPASGFQLTSPIVFERQPDGGQLVARASSPAVPRFQLTSPIALLSPPDGGGVLAFDSAQANQAAPPPPQVTQVTKQIKQKVRRWHVGGRIGAGFNPELFMFGLQSQIGPIFNPRLIFRPNAEFGFGELTDMFDLNVEAAYRLRTELRGRWTPYFGMGPSFNFVHQGTSTKDVSFSNFSYSTGFNVFLGAQKDRTFVELKTSLWSAKTPVLRVFIGYNF